MKILKIGGQNIASLAREFSLDLEAEPLGNAGLFAITGPTGSGKTALLDTMCLALFDQVPRFRGKANFKIADHQANDEKLGANDVKHFLRKGAVSGFAQVQFRGSDHRTYTARWEIRRARGKVSGKIQDQIMSLLDDDTGAELGDHRKTETLRLIREKLGLDFDQFCRSVLLAQGEFAAFLKADARGRSDLLERMTGTEIYTRLSEAAFLRHKLEKDALETLEIQKDARDLLDDEVRRRIETEITELETRLKDLAERHESNRRDLEWYDVFEELEQRYREAEQALEKARADQAALETERTLIDTVVAALNVMPHLEARDRELEAVTRLQTENGQTEIRLTELSLKLKTAESAAHAALAKSRDAREVLDRAHPDLARARGLDSALQEGKTQLEDARRTLQEAVSQHNKVKSMQTDLAETIVTLERRLGEAESWFEIHQDDRVLADQWDHWERQLEKLAVDLDRVRRATGLIAEAEEAGARLQPGLEQAKEEVETAKSAHVDAVARAEQAKMHRQEFDLPSIRQEIDALTEMDRALVACSNLLTRTAALNREHGETVTKIENETLRGRELTTRLEELERAGVTCEARREEAVFTLETTRATLSLESRRPELLHEGHPCPLCGATDHPYRTGEAPGHPLLDTWKQRVDALNAEHQQIIREQSAARARNQEIARNLEELKAEAAKQDEREKTLAEERRQNTRRLEELSVAVDPADAGAVDKAHARTEERLAELQTALKEAETARERAVVLAEKAVLAADRLQRADQLLLTREREYQAGLDRLVRLKNDLAAAEETLASQTASCAPLCTGSRDADQLSQDPRTFLDDCRKAARTWVKACERRTRLQNELTEAGNKQTEITASLKEAETILTARRETVNTLTKDQDKRQLERGQLFGGEPVDLVERKLRLTLEEAEIAATETQKTVTDVNNEQLSLNERLRHGKEDLQRRRLELTRLSERLNEMLDANELDEETVLHHRRYDRDWLEDRRRGLNDAAGETSRAETIQRERAGRLQAHKDKGMPAFTRDEMKRSHRIIQEEIEDLRKESHEKRAQLTADRRKRERLAESLPKIAEQKHRTKLWSKLNDLIGSHDGRKFRKYAQSLTLELLLELADVHLNELEPRYRLQRVPHEDLELQIIDRHMGDEIRPLNSLSGGESFLVSLALALALSSLSSERTNIESLFIDEGFGSLDAETLDIALSALDNLQATGRQIGIISHLSSIADRLGVRVKLVRAANGSSRIETAVN
ncbi:MAG: AAA family ATPase [Acidobacteriota bacterium]|nr:AAA family ATPase [Acidobacteriota bacterium]